jgi:tRNA (guanine-N7-)-methyltransferase
MGRKSKLKRFAEIATFPNVYEIDPASESFISNAAGISRDLRGLWSKNHFENNHPIILELACGKGDYTVALARNNPEINFIGVDIKGARMWLGALTALENSMHNVAFLRTRIEFITRFFGQGEIEEIWITFPDPFEGKENRRLTSPPFLDRYREILKPRGIVHLKSDSEQLYQYTLEVIQADPRCKIIYNNPDIYSHPVEYEELEHKTYYEKKHLNEGRKIKYIRFTIS